jgi:WD40 repeat protein
MPKKIKFLSSFSVQFALYFCTVLNLRRALPYSHCTRMLSYIPESVASHSDKLLLTRTGKLCNVLVQKLLGNRSDYSKHILSRLYRLDVLPPTLVMGLSLYEGSNEVVLSIPQALPPFLVSSTFDTSLIRIENGSEPTILQKQNSRYSTITSISFPENGSYIVMNGIEDYDADLFRVVEGQMIHVATLIGHKDKVSSFSFHKVHPFFATSSFSDDPTIRIWDFSDPSNVKCVAILNGHNKSVFSVAFHDTLPILASGGADNETILWHLCPQSFSLISSVVLPEQRSWILDLDFHTDLSILAASLENGDIVLWKFSKDFSSVINSEILCHGNYARCLKFHTSAPILVTSSKGGSVKFWRVSLSLPAVCIGEISLGSHFATANCIAFHSKLPIMALATDDESLVIIN